MRFYNGLIITLTFSSLLLGVLLYVPKKTDPFIYASKNEDGNVHVSITENGFEPKNIHVHIGDTVVWTNEGVQRHWPASNDHPTHTGYPQKSPEDCTGSSFDACVGLEHGASWKFTFLKEGSWSYHDHLFPSLTGEVYVGEILQNKESFISALVNFWDGLGGPNCPSSEKFNTLRGSEREALIREIAKQSPKKAWECLKSVAIVNNSVILNVHDLAHLIGNESYVRFGIKGVSVCDTAFAYGCFHGVTEQLLRELGPEAIVGTARSCRDLFPPNSAHADSYTGCLHGMGHGLLAWENMDLGRGLAQCEKLDSQDRSYCFDGVFMEYSSGASLKNYKESDPWAVCRSVDSEFQRACARYQPNTWKRAFGWDTAQAATMCLKGDTPTMKDNCIDSIGFITAQGNPGNKELIKKQCEQIGNYEYVAKCETASALENKFQRYNGWENLTKSICAELVSPWNSYCVSRINQ